MSNKISPKIQRKIENITNLKSKLKDWENLPENEVFKLVKEFEKTPRDEGSSFYIEHFNDSEFAKTLVDIAHVYENNSSLTINIVSALGNMMSRYKLPETDYIYQFMVSNIKRKGVAIYVALWLPGMEKFSDFQNKWEYYMSIKEMSPKRLAEDEFVRIIESNVNNIPLEYQKEVIDYLNSQKKETNSEYLKDFYSEIIDKINN